MNFVRELCSENKRKNVEFGWTSAILSQSVPTFSVSTKKYSKQKEVNVENNCNEFPLTEMQKKELRRICNDYCFSWKRKEVSRKMKKSIAAIIHDTEYNLESFIFYYFTSPDSSWELIKKKKWNISL